MSIDNNDTDSNNNTNDNGILVPRVKVLLCGECGMPLEYCEYGPDYETHCLPWMKKFHVDIYEQYVTKSKKIKNNTSTTIAASSTTTSTSAIATKIKVPKPDTPRTIEQRLIAFYELYEPNKVDTIPSILEKYAGKEDKLFIALVKKYGDEPHDPYYTDSDDDDDDDDNNENIDAGNVDDANGDNDEEEDDDDDEDGDDDTNTKKSKRRGVAAKKVSTAAAVGPMKVIIIKQTQKKKRCLTVVKGIETIIPILKLKDVSKVFSKQFAGSSSVKDNSHIIVQGDHCIDLAVLLIDKFHIAESVIYLDLDNNNQLVPFR